MTRQAARQISPLRKPRNAPWLYLVITLPSMLKARSGPPRGRIKVVLKWGLPGRGVKSAKVRPTPYGYASTCYYPRVGRSHAHAVGRRQTFQTPVCSAPEAPVASARMRAYSTYIVHKTVQVCMLVHQTFEHTHTHTPRSSETAGLTMLYHGCIRCRPPACERGLGGSVMGRPPLLRRQRRVPCAARSHAARSCAAAADARAAALDR